MAERREREERGGREGRTTAGCVFCKIAAGEIAATVVKRGDGLLAFRDANPQAPTHVLVIPNDHVSSLNDAKDAAVLGRLMAFAREVARAEGIAERGYRVVLNTNPDGGQTVFHLHLHVLGGRAMTWPPG
ncbi:MAG TPA: histidine triad nucleotide-binding protein [Gemmatimonadales bacterium]|nr:histidine triad nucleotide-binding protein [Gemmatimonadales bacterium]